LDESEGNQHPQTAQKGAPVLGLESTPRLAESQCFQGVSAIGNPATGAEVFCLVSEAETEVPDEILTLIRLANPETLCLHFSYLRLFASTVPFGAAFTQKIFLPFVSQFTPALRFLE
jgi:hypothetical protein